MRLICETLEAGCLYHQKEMEMKLYEQKDVIQMLLKTKPES